MMVQYLALSFRLIHLIFAVSLDVLSTYPLLMSSPLPMSSLSLSVASSLIALTALIIKPYGIPTALR